MNENQQLELDLGLPAVTAQSEPASGEEQCFETVKQESNEVLGWKQLPLPFEETQVCLCKRKAFATSRLLKRAQAGNHLCRWAALRNASNLG
ncbi:MAG: hypothetical protein KIG95_11880 [Comamonas sp.]|nr:hypothetical protein [Comamonas sp.]